MGAKDRAQLEHFAAGVGDSVFRDGLGNRPLGLCEQEECERRRSHQCGSCKRWLCSYHSRRNYAHGYQGCRTYGG